MYDDVLIERTLVLDDTTDKVPDNKPIRDKNGHFAIIVEVVKLVDEASLLRAGLEAGWERERKLSPPADVDERVGQAELSNVLVNCELLQRR
jgi:hypothetical protein